MVIEGTVLQVAWRADEERPEALPEGFGLAGMHAFHGISLTGDPDAKAVPTPAPSGAARPVVVTKLMVGDPQRSRGARLVPIRFLQSIRDETPAVGLDLF